MKQFTIRQFQTDPTKCLKNGSFKLTRYGKPFAIVIPDRLVAEEITQLSVQEGDEKTQITQEKVKKVVEITQEPVEITQHPQAQRYGKCQNPACRYEGDLVEGVYKEWSETLGEHISKPALLCQKCNQMFQSIV